MIGWQWRGKQVALAKAATHLLQERELFFSFDALRDHIHSQNSGQFNDGLHNLEGLFTVAHALDKGAVDLEHVEWELVEIAERAITCPEVVHVERRESTHSGSRARSRFLFFEPGVELADRLIVQPLGSFFRRFAEFPFR